MRECLLSALVCLMGLIHSGAVLAGEGKPTVDLAKLRSSVAAVLLDRKTDDWQPALDHLWQRNGGAEIAREPQANGATDIAAQIAEKVEFDSATNQLTWKVVGVSPNGSLTPQDMWQLLSSYFNAAAIEPETFDLVKSGFLASFSKNEDPQEFDILLPPDGLSMSPEELLRVTGFLGTKSFVYSASSCYDLAIKCYLLGLYGDARILLTHAIKQQDSVRCFHLRGTIEMLLGDNEAAKASAQGILTARDTFGAVVAKERVNGPASVQFWHLVAAYQKDRKTDIR